MDKVKQTNFVYYASLKNNNHLSNGTYSTSVAKKECLMCGEIDLKPEYKYCPNCGIRFNENEEEEKD